MMLSMLQSSGLGGLSGSSSLGASGLSGASGSSSDSFMLPMMFLMMEQMLMKQMELLQSGKLSPTSSTSPSTATSTGADTASSLVAGAASTASASQVKELRQPAALQANQARAAAAAASAAANGTDPNVGGYAPSAAPVTSGQTVSVSGNHANPYGEPAHGPLTQGYNSHHNGLDIGVVVGTPIHSSMDGKVVYAGWSPIGYGNLVIVQNGDYQTYYAHLSKIPVSVGQTVQAGSTIGLSGSTGNSTGPHLHYEIRYKGNNIDPTSLTLNKSI